MLVRAVNNPRVSFAAQIRIHVASSQLEKNDVAEEGIRSGPTILNYKVLGKTDFGFEEVRFQLEPHPSFWKPPKKQNFIRKNATGQIVEFLQCQSPDQPDISNPGCFYSTRLSDFFIESSFNRSILDKIDNVRTYSTEFTKCLTQRE